MTDVAWHERTKNLSVALSALLVPVVVALIGYFTQSVLKQSDTRLEFVRIAIDILETTPEQENKAYREWAAQVLSTNSGHTLDGATSLPTKRDRIEARVRIYCDKPVSSAITSSMTQDGISGVRHASYRPPEPGGRHSVLIIYDKTTAIPAVLDHLRANTITPTGLGNAAIHDAGLPRWPEE